MASTGEEKKKRELETLLRVCHRRVGNRFRLCNIEVVVCYKKKHESYGRIIYNGIVLV